jgi:hypothetical protein
MIKGLLITSALSIAIGAIGGYYLQKLESQPFTKKDSGEAIAAPPKQVDLRPTSKRSELELKYGLCTNSKPDPKTLNRLDDKTLNDLVYQACTENS